MSAVALLNRFKPYPDYERVLSGWVGEVPTHWGVKRLKYVASLNDDALTEDTSPDHEILYVDISSVDSAAGIIQRESLVFAQAPSRARRLVRDGDVIVSTVRTYLRAIAPIAHPEQNLVVSTGFAVVRPRLDIDSGFLAYALRAPYFVDRVVAYSSGVSYPAINEAELATFPVVLPPLPEQRAIANFLDRETTRIDALIAKKERLIELLHEKRAALITRAVTKGLDPNALVKNSGMEWLGQIPAHWKLTTIKRSSNWVQTGSTPPTSVPEYYDDGDIPWYGPSSFGLDLLLREPARRIATQALRDQVIRIFPAGSTLVVTIGATIGKVGYIDQEASSNQQITAINFDETMTFPKFGAYYMKQLESVLRGISPSTTLPILDQHEIGRLPFLVPPLHEQRAITDFLDQETLKIDSLMKKVREGIDRLKEYRTALISAAVTGKIDVRGQALEVIQSG